MNYREIRRAAVWSYEFHRSIDGRVPPAVGTRPYEKLPIPTDLAIVHIIVLVVSRWSTCHTGHARDGSAEKRLLSARILTNAYPLSAETLEPLARFVRKIPKDSNLAEDSFPGLINQEFLGSFSTNYSIRSA